jgi:peroxiredoxin Q/BCP
MSLIEPGRKAPAFSAPDQSGTVHSLKGLAGSTFVLYFYPKDDTSGCTVEACSFRDGWAKYRKAGVQVLGVSPDGPASHTKFARKFKLPFPLLVDEPASGKAPKLCSAFGVWQEKSMYGHSYMGVARTTYVIGPDGKVLARFDKVKPDGHADKVLAAIAALPSAACKASKSSSGSSASTPARTSRATRPATPRASTSTRASKAR